MKIPVTQSPRSSMVFDHASMNSLAEGTLRAWANQLLDLELFPDSVVDTATSTILPPEKIYPQLEKICHDLSIDASKGFQHLIEEALIQEYLSGMYTASHIIFACGRVQRESGFPEKLTAKFIYDEGKETVIYRGMESGISGTELEAQCLVYLRKIGLER